MSQIKVILNRSTVILTNCIVALCLLSNLLASQTASLVLDSVATEPLYFIEFNITDHDYKGIQKALDFDIEFKKPEISINGNSHPIKLITTRGKSSLKQRRKSYTVKLKGSIIIHFNSGDKTLENFYLISMSMDRNYVHNRFAFDCLNALGIFPLAHRYVSLKINNIDEGIYLLTERPFDYILGELASPYALRRLQSGVIDKDRAADNIRGSDIKMYRKRFKQIHKSLKETYHSEHYHILDAQIDMQAYMRWLAFNYLVRNGDYTDELYCYILPGTDSVRFGIMPWDFDDILAREPHEGKEGRARFDKDKLLFSTEDPLDQIIARDSVLYAIYLKELHTVVEILSENKLKEIITNIYADLLPYYGRPIIIAASRYDVFGETNEDKLREYLQKLYEFVLEREGIIQLYE